MKVTLETDDVDEAHQMILAMNVLADLDDFARYLRDKLKYAVADVQTIEEIYGEFCEGVGKHLE